ncbi:hypothetical protein DFH08DRAFT_126273 [Mycena albidolilacea]|uniref:Uncharacterized protein n=1 Tax=Mycena albidolilacea TaxID=1033008 RepID=A0AAD7ESR8_9AGAR|nr:hypothetical protein DFH08DRAFT_126273 [Mycena albidolilacea]
MAFVVCSQRRLFHLMSLHQIPSYERTVHLLATSPHLGPYFRYLALDITVIPKDYAVLKTILNILSGLEYLSLWGLADRRDEQSQAQNPCFIHPPNPQMSWIPRPSRYPIFALISRALSSCEKVSLAPVSIAEESDDLALVDEVSAPGDLWHLSVRTDLSETIMPFILHLKRIELLRQLERFSVGFPPSRNRSSSTSRSSWLRVQTRSNI